MADLPLPAGFIAAAAALNDWLEGFGAKGVIIGGVASSLLGKPRLTQDLDVLTIVAEEGWPALLAAAAAHDIASRIDAPMEFARRTRVLLMRHVPSGIDIDVTLGGLQFEIDAVQSAAPHPLGPLLVRLPRVEDLMIMKAIAHRPRDMLDLDGLLSRHPRADLARVRNFLEEFSRAASMPDVLSNWDRLLVRRRPGVQDED